MGLFDALFGSPRARSTEKEDARRIKRERARIVETLKSFKPGKLHPKVKKRLNFKPTLGRIYLPTETARALWIAEFLDQISDGIWENVGMDLSDDAFSKEEWDLIRSHWVYWRFLDPVLGSPPRVVNKDRPYLVERAYKLAREQKWLLGSKHPLEEQMLRTGSLIDPTYDRKKLHADIKAIFKAMKSAWTARR